MRLSIPFIAALAVLGFGLGSAHPLAQEDDPPLSWIRIRYVDSNGKPIINTSVRLVSLRGTDPSKPPDVKETDAEGEWQYDVEHKDFALPIGYYPDTGAAGIRDMVDTAAQEQTPVVELICHPELSAGGNLVGADGKPVTQGGVFMYPDRTWEGGPKWFYEMADADMWASDRHEIEQQLLGTGIHAKQGDKTLSFERDDWRLFDLQRRDDHRLTSAIDENGHFEISTLCPGRYFVWAWDNAGGYSVGETIVDTSTDELKVELNAPPTGSLQVNVRLPEQEGQWNRTHWLILDGNNGHVQDCEYWWYIWEIEVPPGGTTSIDVDGIPPGYHRAYLEDAPHRFIEIKTGRQAEVGLCDGHSLLATLECELFLDGERLEKARFNVHEPGDKLWKALDSWEDDDEGRVFKLHPGKYFVRCGDFWKGEVELKPGQNHKLKAELESVEVHFGLIDELKSPQRPYQLSCKAEVEAVSLSSKLTQFAASEFKPGHTTLRLPPCLIGYELYNRYVKLSGTLDLRRNAESEVTLGSSLSNELGFCTVQIIGEDDWHVSFWEQSSRSQQMQHTETLLRSEISTRYEDGERSFVVQTHVRRGHVGVGIESGAVYLPYTHGDTVVVRESDLRGAPTICFEPDASSGVMYDHLPDEAVRIVDASKRVWEAHWIDEEGVAFPCAPGTAEVRLTRYKEVAPDLDRWTLQHSTFDVELSAKITVIDPAELLWDDDIRGELEVRVNGLGTDPDVATTVYHSETMWRSRMGMESRGAHPVVESLNEPRVDYPTVIDFPVIHNSPTLTRVNSTKLFPGRYRVIPWPGAPKSLWREVEVKSGETTVVEIELP